MVRYLAAAKIRLGNQLRCDGGTFRSWVKRLQEQLSIFLEGIGKKFASGSSCSIPPVA